MNKKPILSSAVGNNADMFPNILELYAFKGATIADVTYGTGAFWKKIDRNFYNLLISDIQTGTDFRNLPYPDSSIDMVVLDPPYVYSPKGSIKESISKGYALNGEKGGALLTTQNDVLQLYFDGIKEAHRVLKKHGFLVIKTKDVIQSGKQFWMHSKLLELEGFIAEDLFVLTQTTIPAMDPKWKSQQHARKNHSYFLIHKKK